MKKFLACLLSLSLLHGIANAAEYTIDASHSTVGFKVRHLAISSVAGQFSEVAGTFSFDPKDVKASKAEATISAKSINTQDAKRDDHLRSPEFFDAEKFKELKFVSKEIKDATPSSFKVVGDLTIHGVTKSVTLDVVVGGTAKDPWGNERIAFSASTKIDRKDFGLTWSKVLETGALVVGDEVTISIEVEGIKKA